MTLYDFLVKAGLFVDLPAENISEELKAVDIEIIDDKSGANKVSFGGNKLRVHLPVTKSKAA